MRKVINEIIILFLTRETVIVIMPIITLVAMVIVTLGIRH